MKKLFTILALISCLALVSTSCTEEEVQPSTDTVSTGGGGGASGEKP